MDIEHIVTLALGVLGTGFLSSFFTIRWQRRNADLAKLQDYKEVRYKCIIMLMYAYLNPERELPKLRKYRPEITTRTELEEELRNEHINSFLYASDYFIRSFHEFLANPSQRTLQGCALAIRKDLWGIKSRIDLGDLNSK